MTSWVESRRAGRGNTAAFELLWERHYNGTYQTILRVLGPHGSFADEIFQDTWLEVTRARSYRPGSFHGFIRTVAMRKALDRLAAASVRMTVADPTPPEDEPEGPTPSSLVTIDPGRGAHAREAARIVLETVARLSTPQRVAWTLRYVEQLTFEEIAQAMKTPTGTAKTRIRLANGALAQLLQERGIDPADLECEP
jgi:RNA polymerase sigma-70 factor (ECF subfamily)